jgi:4a-hydroxytetrahydrobiopterin dehydratase
MSEKIVTQKEINELKAIIPAWQIVEQNGVKHLKREYEFENFKQALAFTNRVGDIAEQENHHPKLITEWGEVTVTWWSHEIGGLQPDDFLMAARTDKQYES